MHIIILCCAHIHSLFEEEISHFTFPVPSSTTTTTTGSNSVTTAAAALPVVDRERNVPRLSPESSRQQTEHLLSSLSSTSSDVQISALNFDLNERIEQPRQQNSAVDRHSHTCRLFCVENLIVCDSYFHNFQISAVWHSLSLSLSPPSLPRWWYSNWLHHWVFPPA